MSVFELLDLPSVWFVLIGVFLAGYSILDGFDMGVGTLHLFTKGDMERRLMLNSIGPVWDGNEVWLVTSGGALLAAFPDVYATVFSGFYSLFMLFIFGILFRAVSIEFRSKNTNPTWRKIWDVCFFLGSVIPAFLIGLIIGNLICGIPLDDHFEYVGSFWDLFNPYAVCVGLMIVTRFALHGAIYVYLKTEGDFQEKMACWIRRCSIVFLCFYLLVNALTLILQDHLRDIVYERPYLIFFFLLNIGCVGTLYYYINKHKAGKAFLFSCLSIASLILLFGLTMYPNLVFSIPDIQNTLNIYNASSTPKTLTVMLIIAILGFPIVLTYTITIYWIYRGKVKINETSY